MKYLLLIAAALAILAIAFALVSSVMNGRVVRELREAPESERAAQVMLLTLPSGKAIPVNYLREGDRVYAGADFPWWRQLRGEGAAVTVLIQGQTLRGHGRAIEDDPALRAEVFERLRPTAPTWTGTLVAIALTQP